MNLSDKAIVAENDISMFPSLSKDAFMYTKVKGYGRLVY